MVKYGVGIIEESGYIGEKITFKSDQEPSIVALKNAISAARGSERQCLLSRLFDGTCG